MKTVPGHIRKTSAHFLKTFKELVIYLYAEKFWHIMLFIFVLASACAGCIIFIERNAVGNNIRNLSDAFWWFFVTFTTTGYGDKLPVSPAGRFIAVLIMFVGIATTSLLTATISSLFVEKKIREGKGLENVKLKHHIVICGFNAHSTNVITEIVKELDRQFSGLVLVNELREDEMAGILSNFNLQNLKFVRGNFTNENVLRRANIEHAKAVIILADSSHDQTMKKADERTIIGTMAIKSFSKDIRIYAELLNASNEPNLRRANVDEIIIDGEFDNFLITRAVFSPGVSHVVRELLAQSGGNSFRRQAIPSRFVGKTFREVAEYFLLERRAVLIGTIKDEKEMTLDDMLSFDTSAIDEFIKQKFQLANDEYFSTKGALETNLNPDPGYLISEGDEAIVISQEAGAKDA